MNEPSQRKQVTEETDPYEIVCPRCGSTDWNCWDERTHWFRNRETGEDYEFPVGYMHCKSCDKSFLHTWADGEDVDDEYYDE